MARRHRAQLRHSVRRTDQSPAGPRLWWTGLVALLFVGLVWSSPVEAARAGKRGQVSQRKHTAKARPAARKSRKSRAVRHVAPARRRASHQAKPRRRSAKAQHKQGAGGRKAASIRSRASSASRAAAVAKARAAREAAALKKRCAGRKARKSPECRALAAQRQEAAAAASAARDARYCRAKSHRRSQRCRRHFAEVGKQAMHRRMCGRSWRTARSGDTVERFARRHQVAPGLVRAWNNLGNARRLRRGKRYITWRSPLEGQRLHGGTLMEPEPGLLTLQRPHRGWGRPVTVQAIRAAALAARGEDVDAPQLIVGDLSKKGGGCLPPHKSHRGGLDADIGFFQNDGVQRGWMTMTTPENIDAPRTWTFMKALVASGKLQLAFIDYRLQARIYEAATLAGESTVTLAEVFQYPRPRSEPPTGIIRHLKGHADHMHVRFECPPGPDCTLSEPILEAMRDTGKPLRLLATRESEPSPPPAGPALTAPPIRATPME